MIGIKIYFYFHKTNNEIYLDNYLFIYDACLIISFMQTNNKHMIKKDNEG